MSPDKLISCVKKVKAKGGRSSEYAWPICIKSTGQRPHKSKKSKKGKGGKK